MFFLVELDDDVKKIFDRISIELQITLVKMVGVGGEGISKWKAVKMDKHTHKNVFLACLLQRLIIFVVCCKEVASLSK